jgi:CSLREA domain-containing protein
MLRTILVLSALALIGWQGRPAVAGEQFAVDSLLDGVDAAPGDGICRTAQGECTLRAAVQEANALAGADEISIGEGWHLLSIPGSDDDASAGDLDITDDLTIRGAHWRRAWLNATRTSRRLKCTRARA